MTNDEYKAQVLDLLGRIAGAVETTTAQTGAVLNAYANMQCAVAQLCTDVIEIQDVIRRTPCRRDLDERSTELTRSLGRAAHVEPLSPASLIVLRLPERDPDASDLQPAAGGPPQAANEIRLPL